MWLSVHRRHIPSVAVMALTMELRAVLVAGLLVVCVAIGPTPTEDALKQAPFDKQAAEFIATLSEDLQIQCNELQKKDGISM